MSSAPSKKAASTARRKPAAPTVAPADAAPAAAADAPVGTALRLKELVERVAASTGGKKNGVREVVEATLTQLGLALQNGEMLNLPALGKVRVAKTQGSGAGAAMTLKLRRGGEGGKKKAVENPAEQPLAETADQG